MKFFALAALLTVVSPAALCGNAVGTIEQIELGPVYGTKVFIRIAGDITGQPACQNNNFHFAFDTSETGGRDVLSTVLAAKAAKQKVRVSGYSQCTRYSGIEDLRWLRLE